MAEIKLRAVRKIGELSSQLPKAENQHALSNGEKSKNQTLKEAGLSIAQAFRAERIASIAEEEKINGANLVEINL